MFKISVCSSSLSLHHWHLGNPNQPSPERLINQSFSLYRKLKRRHRGTKKWRVGFGSSAESKGNSSLLPGLNPHPSRSAPIGHELRIFYPSRDHLFWNFQPFRSSILERELSLLFMDWSATFKFKSINFWNYLLKDWNLDTLLDSQFKTLVINHLINQRTNTVI